VLVLLCGAEPAGTSRPVLNSPALLVLSTMLAFLCERCCCTNSSKVLVLLLSDLARAAVEVGSSGAVRPRRSCRVLRLLMGCGIAGCSNGKTMQQRNSVKQHRIARLM